MLCRVEPHLETAPENRLKSRFYYLIFENHTFVTLSPVSFELFLWCFLVKFNRISSGIKVKSATQTK